MQPQTTPCKINKILPSAKPLPINISYHGAKFQQNMGWHLVQYLLATFVQDRCRAEQKIRFYCFRLFIWKKKKITRSYYGVQLRWGAAMWTCCEVPRFPCSLLVRPGWNRQQGRPKVRNMGAPELSVNARWAHITMLTWTTRVSSCSSRENVSYNQHRLCGGWEHC